MSGSQNFYFSLLGRLLGDKLVLQVLEAGSNEEIKPGHIFCDINALNQLVSAPEDDKNIAGYPIVELIVEKNSQ